jgi:glutaconate CoA-transferase subunit B
VSHTIDEQIAWCLARQCRPDDVLVVGVATPLAAAAGQLARELIHPDLVLIEAAAVDVAPHDVSTPMVRPEVIAAEAAGVYTQAEILDVIQRGRISLQFVSPAQVDGAGNLNTSRVRAQDGSLRRLPGGLATADIARLMGRLVVYRASHEPRFLPERADFVTGAAGRVAAIVTSKAVLAWNGTGFRLASVHEGSTVDEVRTATGFTLDVPDSVPTTEPPPSEALRALREWIDPHGMRRLETREGRAAALQALVGRLTTSDLK